MATERLAHIRAARRHLAEHGPPRTRDIEGDFGLVSLPADDGDVVRDLLVQEGAVTVIEIGLAYGSSALAVGEALLANAADEARHLVVDPYQTTAFADAGWQVLVDAGLDEICTLMRERSQIVLPRLLNEGFAADAAFVDGSHHFHNVFVDLYYLGELVRPGGLILLDDVPWPSVAAAARYFERNRGWRMLDDPGPDRSERIRALRVPDSPVERSFEDFEPFC